MGKIGRTLFGGPEKKREDSWNNAWPMLQSSLGPAVGYVTQGGNMLSALLNGSTAGADAFANTGGLKFLQDQMQQSVNSSQSARGLLKSGSTLKALQDRGFGLSKTYLNDYVQSLLGFGQLGLGAGGILAEAGRQSKGKAEGEKKGVIPSIIQGIAGFKGGGGGGG